MDPTDAPNNNVARVQRIRDLGYEWGTSVASGGYPRLGARSVVVECPSQTQS